MTPTEFARLADDLDTVNYVDARVSDLRGHPAIDFAERIVASPRFAPSDARWLTDER